VRWAKARALRVAVRRTISGVPNRPARYDRVADEYEAMFGDAVDDPATASLLELVGDVEGMRLLDVPCGQGRVARELTRLGAEVVGVDLSSAMLEKARAFETAAPPGITYLQADAAASDALAGETFDGVVSNYGLSDIDDLPGFLATVTRVMRSGGLFGFSLLHPCFPGLGDEVSGDWPPDGGYYQEGWWRADGAASDLRREVGSNHRMLSTYVSALAAHGLVLEALVERAMPDIAVPMFLAGRCRKRGH
jgi:SAM-dependent methyltransferase